MATYPAASVVYVHPPGPAKGWGRNRSPRIRPYPMSLSAFADLRFTIEDLVAEGDKVVACFSMSAAHRGELWGIPPTGKQLRLTVMEISSARKGAFSEGRVRARKMASW